MSYLLNEPTVFTDEMVDGFVRAHRGLVRRVNGGIARATRTTAGQVAVVIGGGSGHYPAFAGLVGPGLAHGAALGNVFASPSAQQIYSVAKAVATEAGVLLTYGNYAGDVLNFDQAAARLIAEGIPCRSVPVTDDIASASEAEREKRRGIAGDLAVFRAAAWAAEGGRSLDEVFELARRANDRTRTLGVAFSGCTLPGSHAPLFTVPEGRMAVGMGIHGEPGIEEQPMPTARELAHLFVRRLLDGRTEQLPAGRGARAGLILNGLGSVKSEELFVTYSTVADLLEESGIEIVEPEVGEFATSFEMAGASLTLFWLDDELEAAWRAPVYTAAFRKGLIDRPAETAPGDEGASASEAEIPWSSEESRASVVVVVDAVEAIKTSIDSNVGELGRLDSVAGDGDHGIGMQRGATAAARAAGDAAARGAGAGTVLVLAGDAWADRAGGTSGALWGAALRAMGTSLGDTDAPTAAGCAAAVTAAQEAIARFGKARLGDKTMVDALVPFTESLGRRVEDGASLAEAWQKAAEDAADAARRTADLVPKIGRARPHIEKSLGSPDPGAVSLALAVTAVGQVLKRTEGERP